MSDAVEDLADAGLDVEKLSPTADGYSYVWDMKQDLMFLLDDKKNVVAPSDKTLSETREVFAVIHNGDQKDAWKDYAQYIAADYPEQEISYNLLTSVDTGKSGVKDVSISGNEAETSVIRMDGGTLTFEDASADAKFYGKADKVVITKVKDGSFHVYGEVSTVELNSGRVVLESGSATGSVVATGTEANLTTNKGAELGGVGYTTTNKPSGITDAVKVDEAVYGKFAGGLGTEKSPYLISSQKEFESINDFYNSKEEKVAFNGNIYNFKQINNLVFNKAMDLHAFSGTYDGNGFSISYSDDVTALNSDLFDFAFGKTVIKNLTHHLKANQASTIIYRNDYYVDPLDLTFENVTIESNDETVIADGTNFGFFTNFAVYNMLNAKFINCTNRANLNNAGTSTGAFVGSGWDFETDSQYGMFNVEYKNCFNFGNITGSQYVGMLYGNPAYVGVYENNKKIETEYRMAQFAIENVRNEGNITSLYNKGIAEIAPKSSSLSSRVNCSPNLLNVGGIFYNSKHVSVGMDSNYKFKVLNDNDNVKVSYKVAFNINSIKNKDGSYSNTTKYYMNAEKTNSLVTALKSNSFKAVSKKYAEDSSNGITSKTTYSDELCALGEKGGINYLIFDESLMNGQTIEAPIRDDKNNIIGTNYEVSVTIHIYAYQGNELVGNYQL